MFFGCCLGHGGGDSHVVLENVLMAWGLEVEETGGILHNWKVKSPLAGMT